MSLYTRNLQVKNEKIKYTATEYKAFDLSGGLARLWTSTISETILFSWRSFLYSS